MIVLRKLYIIIFILVLPTVTYADFEQYLQQYFDQLEKERSAVLVTKCFSRKDHGYEADLIIDMALRKGLLIERNGKVVNNLAAVEINEKGISLVETHGGIYSYERVTTLIKGLLKKEFRVHAPFLKSDFEKQKALEKCKTNNIAKKK